MTVPEGDNKKKLGAGMVIFSMLALSYIMYIITRKPRG